MGRKAQEPRYYKGRGAYYTTRHGKQHLLAIGPENDEATKQKAWEEFCAVHRGDRDTAKVENPVIGSVIGRYYTHLKQHRKPGTVGLRKVYLDPFRAEFGSLPVADLRPDAVADWLAGRDNWNGQSRRNFISSIHACLNLAVRRQWVTANPLKGRIDMPPSHSRGEEKGRLISAGEHRLIMSRCHASLADLLTLLYETGCRPHEVARAEAKHYRPDGPCIMLPGDLTDPASGKTARSKGARTVWLTPPCVAIVERLAALHPEGPIFCDKHGRPWRHNTIHHAFDYWRAKVGLPDGVCPYSYRHAYCTEWIRAGRSLVLLAKLVGTSVKMLETHYCTARNLGDALPDHALDFHTARAGQGQAG